MPDRKEAAFVQDASVYCRDIHPEGFVSSHDAVVFAFQRDFPAYFTHLQRLQYIMRFLYKEALQRGFSTCWQLPPLKPVQICGNFSTKNGGKSRDVGIDVQSKDQQFPEVHLLREQQPEEIIDAYDEMVLRLKRKLPQCEHQLTLLQSIMHSFYDMAMQRGLAECWHQQQAEGFYMRKVADDECKESQKRVISSPVIYPEAKKKRVSQCKSEVEDEEWLPPVLKKHNEVKVR
jgi:hypothetical protein